ncbi:MAG: response regulator [Acidobacteriota bacterium]|nr:response regulator [Blastocatellia bacterium]MDW8412065.1 response regulator [Acidobacteriota bacterium]
MSILSRFTTGNLDVKVAREIERLRQLLAQRPNDQEALRQLGSAYESIGMANEAIEAFSTLARTYQQSNMMQLAIAYYRKAEKLASGEVKASILKNIEAIYRSMGNFDEAYKISRQIVEYYLSIGQKEAARGYVNSLPPYGLKDAIYRKELVEMIGLKDEKWMQGQVSGSWIEGLPKATQLVASLPGYPSARIPVASRQEKDLFATMKVLIVDDDPGICKVLSTALKAIGCQTITAADGLEGLETARCERPDLIVSDLLMPKMDGNQLFTELSKEQELRDIPFVCLSSRGQEEEKLAAFDKGVEEYWVKPFVLSEIIARAKKLLQRQYQKKHQIDLNYKNFELAGNLRLLPCAQVLKILESGQVTGLLGLNNSQQEVGFILLENGQPVDARTGDYYGEHALFLMLYWQEGHFAFQTRQFQATRTIFGTLDELFAKLRNAYEEQLLIEQLPDKETILRFVPAEIGANFEKLYPLFDGNRTLGECLSHLRGDIDSIRLIMELYKQGMLSS